MNLFTNYTAIDIGTASIKAVSLDHVEGSAGYRPRALICESIPDGLVSGGFTNPSVSNFREFEKLLNTVFTKLQGSKDGCIVGLPDRWVKLHLYDVTLKPEEAASSEYLRWRMKRDLQVPAGMSVDIDYQMLAVNETPEGLTFRYMVGMVKSDIVAALSKYLADMHVQVMAFDTSSLGVYNLLESLCPENTLDRHIMLLHIGHDTTVVKCFENGILRYERVIEAAGAEFSQRCADVLSESAEAVEKYKKTENFFPVDKAEVLAAVNRRHEIERIFGNWLRELNVTVRFYQEKFKIQKLPRLYITGGSSLFYGLPEFLSVYTGTICERFNPLEMLPGCEISDASVRECGPRFAPCLGLLVE